MRDKKPSTLLNEMYNLAANDIPSETVITVWKERLPPEVAVLLDDELVEANRQKLAEKADRVFERLSRCNNTINAISTADNTEESMSKLQDTVSQLTSTLAQFAHKIEALENNRGNTRRQSRYDHYRKDRSNNRDDSRRNNWKSTSPHRGRSSRSSSGHNKVRFKSRSPGVKEKSKRKLCHYHQKFGSKAYKCAGECDWEKETNTNKYRHRSPSTDNEKNQGNRRHPY
jgi:gas vesicle protein